MLPVSLLCESSVLARNPLRWPQPSQSSCWITVQNWCRTDWEELMVKDILVIIQPNYTWLPIIIWLCVCVGGVTPFRAPWESAGIHSLCWHMGHVTTSNPVIVDHWDTLGMTNNNGWVVIEDRTGRFLLRRKQGKQKIIQRRTEGRWNMPIQITKSVKLTLEQKALAQLQF